MASVQINLALEQMFYMSVGMPTTTKIRRYYCSMNREYTSPPQTHTHDYHTRNGRGFSVTHGRAPDTSNAARERERERTNIHLNGDVTSTTLTLSTCVCIHKHRLDSEPKGSTCVSDLES